MCNIVNYCKVKHGKFCCEKCEFKSSCKNACQNTTKKCGKYAKVVNDFSFMKYLIDENRKDSKRIKKCCEEIEKNSLVTNIEYHAAMDELLEISTKLIERNVELKKYLEGTICY